MNLLKKNKKKIFFFFFFDSFFYFDFTHSFFRLWYFLFIKYPCVFFILFREKKLRSHNPIKDRVKLSSFSSRSLAASICSFNRSRDLLNKRSRFLFSLFFPLSPRFTAFCPLWKKIKKKSIFFLVDFPRRRKEKEEKNKHKSAPFPLFSRLLACYLRRWRHYFVSVSCPHNVLTNTRHLFCFIQTHAFLINTLAPSEFFPHAHAKFSLERKRTKRKNRISSVAKLIPFSEKGGE